MFDDVEIVDAAYKRISNGRIGKYVRLISKELTSDEINKLTKLLSAPPFNWRVIEGLSVIKQSLNKLNSENFILNFDTINNSRIWDWESRKTAIQREIKKINFVQNENVKIKSKNQEKIDRNKWALAGRHPNAKYNIKYLNGRNPSGVERKQIIDENTKLTKENSELLIYTTAELTKKISDLNASLNNKDAKRLAIEININAFGFDKTPSEADWRDSLKAEKFLTKERKDEIKLKAKQIFNILKKYGKH